MSGGTSYTNFNPDLRMPRRALPQHPQIRRCPHPSKVYASLERVLQGRQQTLVQERHRQGHERNVQSVG